MKELIDQLEKEKILSPKDFTRLLNGRNTDIREYLFEKSKAVALKHFGNHIYTRGLIEISNYCKNNCYYCGIRAGNTNISRYRLNKEEILECCEIGYDLGFRTFVMQGGEDPYFSDDVMVDIVTSIRTQYPDCAITLSLGEKSYESYKRLFDAGANRYLLRHETATCDHYQKLHPANLLLENRMECLRNLKKIGYQVGTGFMVGSPGQTIKHLVKDLMFIHELNPQMVGIGPFIRHKDTPFANETSGTMEDTIFMLGILRLMLPTALLPATTALGTIDPAGREKGILAGANVVMPNLSPLKDRIKYALYDNKISTGEEAAESRSKLDAKMRTIGYQLVEDRGDYQSN